MKIKITYQDEEEPEVVEDVHKNTQKRPSPTI